ncbi:MAG TPA: hypothetical protein VEK57_18600 [Thermoanaerobaculia bacterium]|nr:hypothetical protein [Thermoanaerobaculia bacterium]
MTFALAFAAFLLLPLFGLFVWRLEDVRKLDLAGRIAIAGAVGIVAVGLVLGLLSVARIDWSRTSVFLPLAAIAVAGVRTARGGTYPSPLKPKTIFLVLFAAIGVLLVYGLVTARMSSGDIHFFWGPKAIRFYREGGVSLAVLHEPSHAYMNRDYPVLLPLLYSWMQTMAHQMSFEAGMLATALFLLAIVAIVRSISGDDATAVVLAAALTYTVAKAPAGGAGEAPLLLFEILALCALTFFQDARTRGIIASIALAGAASTKLEGATFVVAVAIAVVLVQRNVKRAIQVCLPAAITLGGWVAFVKLNGLSGGYGGATMPIFLDVIPLALRQMAKAGSYGVYWLPWLAAIALIVLGDVRRAALPLLVAVLTTGAALFFYIHVPDPTVWIAGSGPRVLLTPLACLYVAAAAAWPGLRDN